MFSTTRTANFRRSLTVSLTKAAVLIAAVLAFVIPMAIGGAFDPAPLSSGDDVMAIRPHLPNSPAGLVARHGCWTGEAPADMQGVVPGHVVVTAAGEDVRHAGPAMVGKALEQLFDGVDHGLRVHGFCR